MVDKQQLTIGCQAKIPGVDTSYGYVPSLGAGIAFCALFGISMILHTVQFCWKRTWWCCVFTIGCMGKSFFVQRSPQGIISSSFTNATDSPLLLVELLGWAGRTWSHECPYNDTAFLLQICTLIIGESPSPVWPRLFQFMAIALH